MTQTPKIEQMRARITAQRQLLDEIAADATTYAVAYFDQAPVGGDLGKKWDQQAAQDRSLAVTAEVASKTLRKLQSGTHTYGRDGGMR